VTITDLIPALKGTGRRRAVDEVDRLRDENRSLLTRLMAADDAFALLRQDLADAHAKQAEAEELVVQLQADKDDLAAERDGLAEELAALKLKFAPQLAAEANATRVTVPPMHRDNSAIEDQATQPIPVLHLPDAAAAGLLGPVLDPGQP
jgi:chromosome segregation ATPase